MRKLFPLFLLLFANTTLWAYDFRVGDLCYNITSQTAPYTVEVANEIGKVASNNYPNLTTVNIPSSVVHNDTTYVVTGIGDYAFWECETLASLTIPESVTYIGKYALASCNCESLISVVIPNSVTSIGDSAFEGCTSLTSINIPDSVTDIGYSAFEGCTSLTSITIPDSVTYIDSDAFYNTAYYNNEANWKNGVLYINNHLIAVKEVKGDYVVREGTRTIASFTGCREMTGITIPDTVTSLQYYAFQGCTSLEKIELPDTLIDVYSNAFEDTAYYNNEENYENNVLYIGKYLIGANDNVNGDITVKDGTKVIANNALRGMYKVKSVKLPDTLEYIGISAFYSCDLTEVVLPESVSFVGFSAFCGCESLKKITILNPQAELDDFTVGGGWPDGYIKAVIHGYDGSTAEAYAKEHNMEFVSLGAYDVKNNITETETVKTVGENSIFAVSENTVEGLLNNIKADVVIKDKDGKDVKNTDILKSGMTVTFTDKDGKAIVPISTARAGNVIGGGDFANDRIIPDSIRAAAEGKDIIVRNPFSTRPYQHVLEPLYAYLVIAMKQYEDSSYADYYNVGPDDVDCFQTGALVDLFVSKWGEGIKWINQYDGGPHEANFL